MKPQIYKVGTNWILWVPGVRVYRFASWNDALSFALESALHGGPMALGARAASNAN